MAEDVLEIILTCGQTQPTMRELQDILQHLKEEAITDAEAEQVEKFARSIGVELC